MRLYVPDRWWLFRGCDPLWRASDSLRDMRARRSGGGDDDDDGCGWLEFCEARHGTRRALGKFDKRPEKTRTR